MPASCVFSWNLWDSPTTTVLPFRVHRDAGVDDDRLVGRVPCDYVQPDGDAGKVHRHDVRASLVAVVVVGGLLRVDVHNQTPVRVQPPLGVNGVDVQRFCPP